MGKPVIVAISGKSAAGKDTLLQTMKWSTGKLPTKIKDFQYCNILVSDTTRLPRPGEKEGQDYCYISLDEFNKKKTEGQYLEWTIFRNWGYGTSKDQIEPDKINLGIFNAQGLRQLVEMQDEYTILVVYLKCPWQIRLERSYNRDPDNFGLETIRRLGADYIGFFNIKGLLKEFKYHITIESEWNPFYTFKNWVIRSLEREYSL